MPSTRWRYGFSEWNSHYYAEDAAALAGLIDFAPDEAIRRQAKGEVEVLMLADCRHSPHKDQPQATLEAMAGFIELIS